MSTKTECEWQISDSEIREIERILLPEGCHFEDDAVQVIRCWHSTDVFACPGSGKTTVLLSKLKLIADRMPLEHGAGICVLSHTNVAVNEIKKKLAGYTEKLTSYPNYVGTIQTFIDRFITMPYIRRRFGRSVQPVDNITYAKHMMQKLTSGAYSTLNFVTQQHYTNCGGGLTRIEHTAQLYLREDGALCAGNQKRPLAGADKQSAMQFSDLLNDLLVNEGIIRYQDAYKYAGYAVEELSTQYANLFSQRFKYVFIDEYQDCTAMQVATLNRLFAPSKCVVMHIGDADQAIYNSDRDNTVDWKPSEGALSISSSCRYGQEIANVLSPLRKDKGAILSNLKATGLKPILIIYENNSIDKVIGAFITILENKGLHDPHGVYKAIGFIGKAESAGISIGSYWAKYDGIKEKNHEFRYWEAIDSICGELQKGKMYRAELILRKLMCRLFHYANVKDKKTGKDFTLTSLRVTLKEKYSKEYATHIIGLAQLVDYNRQAVDTIVRDIVDELFHGEMQNDSSIFRLIPAHFMEEPTANQKKQTNKNVLIDPIRGREIQFSTVHGVKGETHDATLYLETELSNGSDIKRVLNCYGVGSAGASSLYDYSRKIVYVGMSRPRKLLCLAIQESTYNKSKNAFPERDWDRIFLCAEEKT